MVLAFIITTLTGESPLILYHQIYGQILSTESEAEEKTDERGGAADRQEGVRKLIKEHITQVAEQVHSEYQFRREVNNMTTDEDIQRLSNDDTLPEFEMGHFRVQVPETSSPESESLRQFHHVTWMGAGLTGFILLCDTCENRASAVQVLRLIIRYLQEHVRVLSQPSEIANRVERVAEVLDRVLPDGNLVFMNHRVVRHIEKELENVMKMTT